MTCPHFNSALRQIRYTWIHLRRGWAICVRFVCYTHHGDICSNLHTCIIIFSFWQLWQVPFSTDSQFLHWWIRAVGSCHTFRIQCAIYEFNFRCMTLEQNLYKQFEWRSYFSGLAYVCLWNLDPFVRWRLAQDSFRWIAKRHPFIHVHSCMVAKRIDPKNDISL